MWIILSIIALAGVVIFWKGPNAIWGGMSLGLIAGLIAACIYAFNGHGFLWAVVGKWIVVSVLAGLVVEVVWRIKK